MRKIKLNAIVDILAAISFSISAFSGLIILKILPGGGFRAMSNYFSEKEFLSFTRYQWLSAHNISSLIVTGLVVIHLILHWQWIKNLPRLLKKQQ